MPKDAPIEAHRIVEMTPSCLRPILDDNRDNTEKRCYEDDAAAVHIRCFERFFCKPFRVQRLPLDRSDRKADHGKDSRQHRIVNPVCVVQIVLLDKFAADHMVRVFPHELVERGLISHIHVH